MKGFVHAAGFAAAGLVCVACGDSDDGNNTPTTSDIQLSLTGLEDLTEGAYEGWLIYGDEKVSTGVFTSVTNIQMTTDRNPKDADQFVLTIEPSPDSDPGPSGIVALAGPISAAGDGADLSFGADFGPAEGGFILRTPTDDAAGATDNDSAGVWFLNIGAGGPEVGLTLPTLPEGFVYEGWGVTQGVPLTTGRFTAVDQADLASPYSDGGPPFPGEDFVMDLPGTVTPPIDLADGNSLVVLSVEPDLNGADPTGDAPFALKPLALSVPAGLAGATYTQLGAGPVASLSGSVTFTAR